MKYNKVPQNQPKGKSMLLLSREKLEVNVSMSARHRARLDVFLYAQDRDVTLEHPGAAPMYIIGASELLAMAYRKDWYVINEERFFKFTQGWFAIERNHLRADLLKLQG
jgi:hypothetical protein